MIHKEGYPTLTIGALVLGLLSFTVYKFCPEIIFDIILFASVIVYIILLQFFRNPSRKTIVSDDTVIAPCDGKLW